MCAAAQRLWDPCALFCPGLCQLLVVMILLDGINVVLRPQGDVGFKGKYL